MKIKFEENLKYQLEAIKSITDIFRGQEINRNVFTVESTHENQLFGKVENYFGIGNGLLLHKEDILDNLNKIQTKNGLEKTKDINKSNYNFSVEMETGTGKTYVYLRTIMELNKNYGFTKFIIVVPSIAIKEGVYKTLEITKDHFKLLYDNLPYDYFIYDSKKIDTIRNFAVSDNLQIMIINIDSFNKDSNVINQERDQANGYRPIEYIKQCNPIIIVDEPQNMESENAKKAISQLNPLCTLRYSATHRDKYNQVFKLDSIDAYENQLVKQIEVSTIELINNTNTDYIKLQSIKLTKTGINATVELDVKSRNKIIRKNVTIKNGDDLKDLASRNIYDGYIVNEITYNKNDISKSYVDFGKVKLYIGQLNGEENPETIKRLQIRKTIQEHLEKQKRLKSSGIKVLSLFFIDRVANYRLYNLDTGDKEKGKYALIFEEEYNKLLETKEYKDEGFHPAHLVHDGYFSGDKKKSSNGQEYFLEKDTKGTTNSDNDTFNKIMRDKEKLLSFEEPLSFIFSHSALKEGWDNPNVFQICTLNETTSEIKKRQEIGRGLRICVNQQGERIRGFDVNTLTVMANESYDQFVSSLQTEMEKDENIRFGKIESFIFSNVIVSNENGKEVYLGHDKSEEIYQYLLINNYIDHEGNIQDKLKIELNENKLELPTEFNEIRDKIVRKLESRVTNLVIKNASDKKKIELNKEILISPEFKELWDKIKHKTVYKVNFNSEELIKKCVTSIDDLVYIPEEKYRYTKSSLKLSEGGIKKENEILETNKTYSVYSYKLPDIVSYLQNETNLTRKSIVKILTKTKTLESFKKNPQFYIEQVTEIIKNIMKEFIVDGIKYEKIGDNEYYCQELFEKEDLYGYFKDEMSKQNNIQESTKSPYKGLILDSEVEKNFALSLENNKNIILYAKLPKWFKISTPLGNYNPDWAVLVRPDLDKYEEKLFFIVETKGSLFENERRELENLKINCGKKHFESISKEVTFKTTNSFNDFSSIF
ncbi:MAG: DEAD/DEAH box helicase family protein [Leptotrichiaceae bacterium]|nr:DEAD/DEAH box helicase family protein [Leptotrichiaceae bacterium]MBP7739507.1 DEAD/DEAH box helicase family protein [Leptotrichiaceae bacterium]